MKKWMVWLAVIGIAFLSLSCQKKAKVKGVELAVKFFESALSDNLITDMEFRWKTSGDFEKLGRDYNIFVHFWHKSNMLFQDDHLPTLPTSKWEPGKEYTYSRRIYIPAFIDEFDPQFKGEEELKLVVGFYSAYDRSGKSKRDVLVKKLVVIPPPPDTPEIVYESGWYNLEVNPDSHLKQWRWTGKEARCIIDNPRRDALLVIRGGANAEVFKDQRIIFKINDLILDEFFPENGLYDKSYNIKKEMLGDKDEFVLVVTTDKTFVPAKIIPASKDERELGIQVSFLYFR